MQEKGSLTVAASELAELHEAAFGWALFCCAYRNEEAEEVLQTAYMRVLDGSAVFTPGVASLRTWVFGVIRNVARERSRRSGRRQALLSQWFRGSALDKEPDSPAVQSEMSDEQAVVWQALQRLSERQREILYLVFYRDMTIAEAATVMKVGVGTARTHYERAKKELVKFLPEELQQNEEG